MTTQYLREFSAVVGVPGSTALDFKDFRVSFRVNRGDTQNPNTCDLRIYNLSDATANRIQDEFTYIAVKAGYEGNFGLIFKGTIRQVRRGRIDQLNSYVDITAADADEAYNFAFVSLSLAAGQATPQNSIEHLLKTMAIYGVTGGYTPELPQSALPRGKVFYGMTRDELRDLAVANGLSWNLNDGKLSFIPLTSYQPSSAVPLISPQTGLIGIPERTANGVSIRTLLNPTVKVGSLVRLQSNAVNLNRYGVDANSLRDALILSQSIKAPTDGFYYVMVANHSGDTRGNDWYSDLICLSVDSTIAPSPASNITSIATPAQPPPNAIKLF